MPEGMEGKPNPNELTARADETKPRLQIKIGPVTRIYKYHSPLSPEITESVIATSEKEAIKPYGSSIIEDSIIKGLRDVKNQEFEPGKYFQESGAAGKIREFLLQTKEKAGELKWETFISEQDIQSVKNHLITKLREFGVSEDVITQIQNAEVAISESYGVSSVTDKGVFASRYQAVRRALDYTSIWGEEEIDFKTVVKALILSTIAHELGHYIDDKAKIPSNHIPRDENWKSGTETGENPGERFAEFWGRSAISDNEQYSLVRHRLKKLDVAKVDQVWKALAEYNQVHPEQKLDIYEIFDKIDSSVDPQDKDIKSFISARQILFSSVTPENYALPYTEEQVRQAFEALKTQ
jgi:hypothetical protein